jgi:hypothetical protein
VDNDNAFKLLKSKRQNNAKEKGQNSYKVHAPLKGIKFTSIVKTILILVKATIGLNNYCFAEPQASNCAWIPQRKTFVKCKV